MGDAEGIRQAARGEPFFCRWGVLGELFAMRRAKTREPGKDAKK
jgi:hypothetical protein